MKRRFLSTALLICSWLIPRLPRAQTDRCHREPNGNEVLTSHLLDSLNFSSDTLTLCCSFRISVMSQHYSFYDAMNYKYWVNDNILQIPYLLACRASVRRRLYTAGGHNVLLSPPLTFHQYFRRRF